MKLSHSMKVLGAMVIVEVDDRLIGIKLANPTQAIISATPQDIPIVDDVGRTIMCSLGPTLYNLDITGYAMEMMVIKKDSARQVALLPATELVLPDGRQEIIEL